jgi:AraC-like DNA-binding protein
MSELNRQVLAGLELRVLTIQRTVAGRWWNFRGVVSPFSRLWLVLGGQGKVRHHGREFPLEPGQLHLVPPFTQHDCSCSRRLDHFHLHFVARLPTGIDLFSLLDCDHRQAAPPHVAGWFRRLEALCPGRTLPCFDPAREEYRRYPVTAEQTAREMAAPDWFEAQGLLHELLAPFVRSARLHEGMHARVSRQFLAVQQFIHEKMRDRILLGDLAAVAGLHPTYFSDRFHKLVGVRPLEYLMRRRIERAQYLLLTSGASVKEVAVEVGIPDAAYFTRAFGRVCGTSPSAYRASHVS